MSSLRKDQTSFGKLLLTLTLTLTLDFVSQLEKPCVLLEADERERSTSMSYEFLQ
jgi:hypothetical protein